MPPKKSARVQAVAIVLGIVLISPVAAFAGLPSGACCFPGGGCEEGSMIECDDAEGVFFATNSCDEVTCSGAMTMAPAASIWGTMGLAVALLTLAIYRLQRRRSTL